MDGITVETKEHGPNGWMALLITGVFAVIGTILAAAIWNMSVGLMVGGAALGIGYGGYWLCRGASEVVLRLGQSRAEIIRAQGEAQARIRDADTRRLMAACQVRQLTGGRE